MKRLARIVCLLLPTDLILWILKEPKKKLGLLIICAVLVGSVACLWRDTGDLFLSIVCGVLAGALVYGMFLAYELAWVASWGDLEETGFHMEDPRHPNNLACADELLVGQEHPAHGIQITPRGDVMLHANPECYTSPFSRN